MNQPQTLRRGAYSRNECVFIGAWFPRAWVQLIDDEIRTSDLDRSKILRKAIKETLRKKGITVREEAA